MGKRSGDRDIHYGTAAVFAILVVVGVVSGALPLVMFLDRPLWLAWVGAGAVFVAAIQTYTLRSIPARALTGLDFVVSLAASPFLSSSVAFMLLLLYGAVRGLFALVGLTGIALPWDGVTVSRGVVAVVGSVLVLGSAATTGELLGRRLFPRSGIGNPPLSPGLSWRRCALIGIAVLAGITVLAVLALRGWWPAWLLIVLVLVTFGAPLHTALEPERVEERKRRTMDAVRRLLKAAGYTVIERLQAREPELDQIIAVFDLVAHSAGHVLAICVKTDDRDAEPVSWSQALSLRTAIRPLYQALERTGVLARTATPVLVLAGRSSNEHLVRFARDASIRIIELNDSEAVTRILSQATSLDELRQLAQTTLGLVAAAATVPPGGGHS